MAATTFSRFSGVLNSGPAGLALPVTPKAAAGFIALNS